MACPKCGCKTVYQFDNEDDVDDDRQQRCAACGEVFDLDDHAYEDEDEDWGTPPPRPPVVAGHHAFDEDAVCSKCGFDGAEWWHWKHMTYEGKAQPDARQPVCTS